MLVDCFGTLWMISGEMASNWHACRSRVADMREQAQRRA
jgi:hypothetical protein